MPGHIAYADAAYDIFSSLPVMRRFGERYTLRTFNGRPLLLETLLEAYREYAGGEAAVAPRTDPATRSRRRWRTPRGSRLRAWQ